MCVCDDGLILTNKILFMLTPSGAHFQWLFESSPGLYLVLWPDFTIVAVSNAYLQATMTKRKEILGRNLFEVFPDNPDDPTATGVSNLRASLMHVLQYKEVHTMAVQKYDIRRPDGSFEERHWNPINKPLINEKNEVVYIIHRVEDVTEFIRLKDDASRQEKLTEEMKRRIQEMEISIYKGAQEIQQINKKLLAEINERQSTEVALQKQTEQLAAANKEMETFSYSVSHDLRAPLRIIDGYAGILAAEYKQHLDEEGQRMLGVVTDNVRHMGRLIDDLLNLSRLGRKELVIHQVDMQQLVKSVISEQRGLQAKVVINISSLESIMGDSNLLQQVWVNLISNALKYSGNQLNPLIKIYSEKKDDCVVYAIEDNGVGFNMKYADKLFGVFQRLHKITEFEGTGVGLALVHQIVTRHGGQVWAEAKVNEGAKFFFCLPYSNHIS